MKKNTFIRLVSALLLCIGITVNLIASEPLLRIGVMTDTHITNDASSVILARKAFELFQKHNVDVVVNVGDLATRPSPDGYKFYRAAFEEVFVEKKPLELYVFAAHDWAGKKSQEESFPVWREQLQFNHDMYFSCDVKGYPLLVIPQYADMAKLEAMLKEASESHPDKPIFLFDHFPATGTVDNSWMWGEPERRRILNKYPDAIQISGHIHGTLRNERNIWQGEFTAVNAGSLSTWMGQMPGTSRASVQDYGVLIVDVHQDKALFRRFDVRNGAEYKPENPWCVPLPFDAATAPYRPEARKLTAGNLTSFAAGAAIRMEPDGTPAKGAVISIPKATEGETTWYYWVDLEEMDDRGDFHRIARRGIIENFHLPLAERPDFLSTNFSTGYVAAGKCYRVTVTPEDFFERMGVPISMCFKMPQTEETQVVFLSGNPMTELKFTTESQGTVYTPTPEGFYMLEDHGLLNIPDVFSTAPADARFRISLDFQCESESEYFWTMAMHCVNPSLDLAWRTSVPLNDYEPQRLSLEFTNSRQKPVHLLFYNGIRGRFFFKRLKVERL